LELIGNSNERQIFYSNIWKDDNWLEDLPKDNWLVFPIGQGNDIDSYSKLVDKSIDNNVLYVCAAGQYSELIHDIFDEMIVQKKIENNESVDNEDDFEDSPITTWHNNFSDGFWFAITTAHHGLKIIDKIVCVDFTKQSVKGHLKDLIEKINNGWLPSDEEIEEPIYDTQRQ